MDPGSNKIKKVSDSSIIKSKEVSMGAKIVLNNSNRRRHKNLVRESKIDFHASRRFLAAINDHAESNYHNKDCSICNDPK